MYFSSFRIKRLGPLTLGIFTFDEYTVRVKYSSSINRSGYQRLSMTSAFFKTAFFHPDIANCTVEVLLASSTLIQIVRPQSLFFVFSCSVATLHLTSMMGEQRILTLFVSAVVMGLCRAVVTSRLQVNVSIVRVWLQYAN